MLLVVMLIAYFQLWDNEIKALSKTVIAGSLFSANLQILFLKKGYFDPDTQENPLLHLWSLGVEEQFYIVWPLISFLLVRTTTFKSYFMITIFFLSSFIGNIFAIYTNPKWAYYFPLCRFWEMVIGGYIALIHHNKRENLNDSENESNNLVLDNLCSFLGIFFIIISSFIINENSLFPGFWAILPTMGSALIIISNNGFINKYLLSSKLFVFIGKISYPLYLWHWPLLVLGKVILKNSPSIPYPTAIVLAISIVLSILTYYLIEKPTNNIKSKSSLVLLLSVAMSFILIIGVLFLFNPIYFSRLTTLRKNFLSKYDHNHINSRNISEKFFPDDFSKNNHYFPKSRTSTKKLIISSYRDEFELFDRLIPVHNQTNEHYSYMGSKFTYLFNYKKENKKVLVVGDSFAEMIIPRIKYLYDAKLIKNFPTVIFKVVSGSWISYPCDDDENIANNLRAHNEMIEYIKKEKPMSVLFSTKPYSGYYPELIDDEEDPDPKNKCQLLSYKFPKKYSRNKFQDLFNKLKKNLKSITDLGIRVYMNTLKLEGELYNPDNMFNNFGIIEEHIQPVNYFDYMNKYQNLKDIVDRALEESGAIKIDYSDNMCRDDFCPVVDFAGFPINRDATHFSHHFAKKHLSVIDKAFMDY